MDKLANDYPDFLRFKNDILYFSPEEQHVGRTFVFKLLAKEQNSEIIVSPYFCQVEVVHALAGGDDVDVNVIKPDEEDPEEMEWLDEMLTDIIDDQEAENNTEKESKDTPMLTSIWEAIVSIFSFF